jgi:hypothetical protein
MKKKIKKLAISFSIATFILTLTLTPMANASGLNFEGMRAANSGDNDTRGIIFNFSFGGNQKSQKRKAAMAEMYKSNLTTGQKVGIGIAAAATIITIIVINNNDDDPAPAPIAEQGGSEG